MDLAANKALARGALAQWAGDCRDDPDALFAAGYVNHQTPSVGGGTADLDLAAWKTLVGEFRTAFPDNRVEILTQVAEGDRVATRWCFAGSQTGSYLGHSPTGRRAAWTGVSIDTVKDGKIAESWVEWDMYQFFKQLGIL